MKIGILGSGVVGKTLAQGFAKHRYKVMIASRDANKLKEFKEKEEILVGNFEETAKFADLIVLAVKGSAAKEALKIVKENLNNKIIIDTTNPIVDQAPENGVLKFFTSLDKSLMEELQREFPQARFVKAFNSIGNAFMGKVEAARAIEPLCILWCIPGFLKNDWSHAFKLLKKQS